MMVVVAVVFDGDEDDSHQPDKQRAFQRDACTLQHVTDCENIEELMISHYHSCTLTITTRPFASHQERQAWVPSGRGRCKTLE